MALLSFAAVTAVWLLLLFVTAGRVVAAEEYEKAAHHYHDNLSRAGKAWGVLALWAFGLRFDHVAGAVAWAVEGVSSLL